MKSLTLLRHAKSGWDDGVARDFDRPLNPRGRRAARVVGERMKVEGLSFDLVLASPAKRVTETIEEVGKAFGPIEAVHDERLYLASPATLLDIVHHADDRFDRLLLVGHNPGLEALALQLTRRGGCAMRSELELKYPTGTLAEIRFEAKRWRDVAANSGELVRFIRPRDLDPELGPED
jgi:phosphohistidine phosphatase